MSICLRMRCGSRHRRNCLKRIGSKAIITFEHKDSGTPYEFSGWVTDVRIDAWESEPDYEFLNHRSNRVHIIGEGGIVKLNGSRGMDSFYGLPA